MNINYLIAEVMKGESREYHFDALEARAWPDYDAILLAARKRRGAENNYLEEPSARDLHEPIDGRNLFRALSVPDPHDQSVHERLMPWRGRG